MALTAGSNIGPYRIIEPVGRGGMASVFKAYEASLDRYVALKVLPPEFLHDPTFAARFRREAQTIARLEHPQIIPIFAYDIDAETGTPWMAMRLIAGGSLSQRIKRGRLPATECARILKDVGDALDYAHAAGVIHRDVKPQNVLLDEAGRVYLADFGIAKMVEASAHMTQTGMITGTPQYMAPEQALGSQVNKSVDIYALGIVAYELFTGRVPFSADTPVAVLMKQASEPMPLPPVSEVREEVTRAILRATAKDPESRWPTASAFAAAVVAATGVEGTTAAPTAVMATGSEEDVPTVATAARKASPAASPREKSTGRPPSPPPAASPTPPADPKRRPGMGLAVAAAVFFGLALLGALAAYLGLRYVRSIQNPQPATTAETLPPSPVPTAMETPAPAPPEPAAAETEAAPSPPAPTPEPPASRPERTRTLPEARPENLTPVERRRILQSREAESRRERLEALAATKRQRMESALAAEQPTAAALSERTTGAPAARATRTRINLEVEASQPSTGAQIGALYAQVVIDNRPIRDFTIRFTGGNSFARWKRVETVVIDDVPLTAREIVLVVATDPGLNQDRLEGSTRLSLEGEETNLSAVVRFYNQFDKSVRFR